MTVLVFNGAAALALLESSRKAAKHSKAYPSTLSLNQFAKNVTKAEALSVEVARILGGDGKRLTD
jgi:hypothetical protein